MANLTALLQAYAKLVDLFDEEYADPDVNILLYQRDEIEDRRAELTAEQLTVLAQADVVFASKWQIVADFVPDSVHTERSRWWWFLHEGPQVREQAHA
jgi:hypothetical protein